MTILESAIRGGFRQYLQEARSKSVLDHVRRLLESKQIGPVVVLADSYILRFSSIIPRAFILAAETQAKSLGVLLHGRVQKAVGDITLGEVVFDPSMPRAAKLMQQNKLRFVQDATTSQRQSIRQALIRGLQNGESTQQMVDRFRDSIGLTDKQELAVYNYKRSLETLQSNALNRTLRDKRFDSTVATAIDDGSMLSTVKINQMVDRYRSRMLDYRAENIARTEAGRITNLARHEATEQMIEQTGINPEEVERTWHSTNDKRVRDSHKEMDGQTVTGLLEPFRSPSGARLMYPGDPSAPPAETINCRCVVTIAIR